MRSAEYKLFFFFFKEARNTSPGTKDKRSLQVFPRIKEFRKKSTPLAGEALKLSSEPALEAFSVLMQDLRCQVCESESNWRLGEHWLEGSPGFLESR